MVTGELSCLGPVLGMEDKTLCVAVYCGAQEPKNDIFNQKAKGKRCIQHPSVLVNKSLHFYFIFAELGGYLASKEIHVTFGGSKFGTMGKIAEGVLEKGGKLTGIIPKFFTGI